MRGLTPHQKVVVLGNFKTKTIKEIATNLGISAKRIYWFLEYRKFFKRPNWGETETYLVENFGTKSCEIIKRTPNAVRIKKFRLKLS